MTDNDFDRTAQAWLEDGPAELSNRVLQAALDEVRVTRQRRASWPARTFRPMQTPIRSVVAAATVIVVALVGINLTQGNGGGAAPALTPTPTQPLAPTPTLSPTASILSAAGTPLLPGSGPIAPGTYGAPFDGGLGSNHAFLTYTLPAGWYALGVSTIATSGANPPKGMAVDLLQIAAVYADPCRKNSMPLVSIGPSVDDLVAAFAGQRRNGERLTPVDTTVGGFSGREIDLMVPSTVNISKCEGGQYSSWLDPAGNQRVNQGAGQHDLLDILDVDGQTLAIGRSFYPANTAADRTELQKIIDSVKIAP